MTPSLLRVAPTRDGLWSVNERGAGREAVRASRDYEGPPEAPEVP